MFRHLLLFDWLFLRSKKSFYLSFLFFPVLGMLLGTAARFPFPNTYINGSYVITYVTGIISLLAIFSTTLLTAQTIFREKESRFDAILYATPLNKAAYVLSRFTLIAGTSALHYVFFIGGLIAGHQLQASGNEHFGPLHLVNYWQPYWILLLPNILFCTAVSVSIGLFTRNKMLVYVSGVFIYFLYWGVSFFTNSPLIANSTPVKDASLHIAALADPFGIAAFLEQTRYYTAPQRNEQLLQLSGQLLANRLIYISASAGLLFSAFKKFSFQPRYRKHKPVAAQQAQQQVALTYTVTGTHPFHLRYHLQCLMHLLQTEWRMIMRSLALWLVCLGWTAFLCIEILSDIGGNARMPEQFATTALLLQAINEQLPLVTGMILLFYSNEICWRSHTTRFAALEQSTAVHPAVLLAARWLSLLFIIGTLLLAAVITATGIQLSKAYTAINWRLYASLLYLTGIPLALSALLITCIQTVIKNRYAGMAVAGIVLLLTQTSMGSIAGMRHPLWQLARPFEGEYSEMNGFDNTLTAFHYQLLYALFVSAVVFILTIKATVSSNSRQSNNRLSGAIVLLIAFAGALLTGSYIYRNTELIDRAAANDRKQAYESRYTFLKNKSQPVITDVTTTIALYPATGSYQVQGNYRLVNQSTQPIDTLYLYGNPDMAWSKWYTPAGTLVHTDKENGYYIFKLNRPLPPDSAMAMQFHFRYTTTTFNKADNFNTIIRNGSFIRISRYFPQPGYQTDLELADTTERKKRSLPPASHLPALDDTGTHAAPFINFEATISTDYHQTAVCIGELLSSWKSNNRSYYRYKSSTPIPFRFAVASAQYAVTTLQQGNTTLAVYYHPGHARNIRHLMQAAAQSLAYCEQHFGKYPFTTARFVEIAALTKGFAGTAYPGSLFINEAFGYQRRITNDAGRDIINEMVSHELSHTWWGNSKIAPDYREGNLLMTETLAMYTELMIYKHTYGQQAILPRVNIHKAIYLSSRSAAGEEPLYRMHPAKSHLAYDKGMVVMYQLYLLLGEQRLNQALRRFCNTYSYPHKAPAATDLLQELYAVATDKERIRIDELLKQIVTYDVILSNAEAHKQSNSQWQLTITGTIRRYQEDGKGQATPQPFTGPVAISIEMENGSTEKAVLPALAGSIHTSLPLTQKPVRVTLDADGSLLNKTAEEDKTQKVTIQ